MQRKCCMYIAGDNSTQKNSRLGSLPVELCSSTRLIQCAGIRIEMRFTTWSTYKHTIIKNAGLILCAPSTTDFHGLLDPSECMTSTLGHYFPTVVFAAL